MFSSIGVREPQPAASEAFSKFGEAHRDMERFAIKMLKTVKPVSLVYSIGTVAIRHLHIFSCFHSIILLHFYAATTLAGHIDLPVSRCLYHKDCVQIGDRAI